MGHLQSSAASIGFFGDDLDPVEITKALGAEPTLGVLKGGVWHTRAGVEKIAKQGSWRMVAEDCEPEDLDGQIADVLDGLSNDLIAWQSFSRRFCGRVFCGLFLASGNDGLSLRSETLARLGERGLRIDFDIYDPSDPK